MNSHHLLAIPKQAIHAVADQNSLGSRQLASEFRPTTRAINGKPKLLNIEWLLQEVDRTIVEKLKCCLKLLPPSKTDDGRCRYAFRCSMKQLATGIYGIGAGIEV